MVHRRGMHHEDHVDLAAQLFRDGDLGLDPRPVFGHKRGVLKAGGADPDDHVPVEIAVQARPIRNRLLRDRELVVGERDRRAPVVDQLGFGQVHRRRPDEGGDKQVGGRVEQVLGAVDLLQLPILQDRHLRAQRHRLDLVVGHIDGGHPQPVVQRRQLPPHRHPQLRIQIAQRLIHQVRLRIAHDRAPHRHPLPLPPTERRGLAVQERFQGQHPGGLLHPPVLLFLGRLAQLQAERQVLPHRHMRIQRIVLEHHRDIAVLGRQVVHHPVADADLALGDVLQPGDHSEGGGLATPRRAHEHHEVPIGDLQAQRVDRPHRPPIDLADLMQLDPRHGYSLHPADWANTCPDLCRPFPKNPSRNTDRGRLHRRWQ
jgi:hypothetical protein